METHNEGSSTPPNHGAGAEGQNAFMQQIISLIDGALARNMTTIERMVDDKISHINHEPHTVLHGTHGKEHTHGEGESSHGKSDRVSFKSFRACGATEYLGTESSIEACAWVENMEKIFVISHCWEDDQVDYATAMLMKDALSWWTARKTSLGEARVKTMSWSEFKIEFMQQYCPDDQKNKYEQEFINLNQGSMTVTAYEAEFNRKSKFAAAMLSSEDIRVRRFVQGLRWSIRESVQMQSPSTLADATRFARMREDILKANDAELMPPPKRTRSDVQPSFFSSNRSSASGRSFS